VQAAVKWRPVSSEDICWREWDGEVVAYGGRTGNTHLLNPLSGLVLRQLAEACSPLSLQELTESIRQRESIESGIPLIEAIETIIAELERLGLVESEFM
jgi:PqqD family protein of HPr-rel-A system